MAIGLFFFDPPIRAPAGINRKIGRAKVVNSEKKFVDGTTINPADE